MLGSTDHPKEVVGHILVRSCQQNVEMLHSELSSTHCHRRMVCVPVEVPSAFYRYLKSAASRSFGPNDDSDKSGVDFAMRTIGRRSDPKDKDPEKKQTAAATDADQDDAEEKESSEEDDKADAPENVPSDPHLMSRKQLQAVFKDSSAEAQSVLFQHSTRMTPAALFLDKSGFIKVRGPHLVHINEPRHAWFFVSLNMFLCSIFCFVPDAGCSCLRRVRAEVQKDGRMKARMYRKAQVHSSVYARAIQSALSTCNVPLGDNEVCVIATGGTPESIVGAIAAGFKNVIYIASDDTEQIMMQLPAECEEREHTINYHECSATHCDVY